MQVDMLMDERRPKSRSIKLVCLTLTVLAIAASPAMAQRRIADEYEKSIKSAEAVGALGNDLFGEQVNLYTGATTFTATDINLVGSSTLPVSLSRRFSVESRDEFDRFNINQRKGGFLDWELDIPHLQGTYGLNYGWQVDGWNETSRNLRCSGGPEPPVVEGRLSDSSGASVWGPSEYWHGNSLHVPGGGSQEMLTAIGSNTAYRPNTGASYPWVTSGLWVFSCLATTASGNAVPGEAFLATAPDGTRYWFNWIVRRPTSMVSRPYDSGGGGGTLALQQHTQSSSKRVATTLMPVTATSMLERDEIWILPTRVEDRHGNWVTYTYNPASPWQLTRILANDGREITLTYNTAGHIATATAGTRTWTYSYTNNSLSQVLLPDGSKWSIGFTNLLLAQTVPNANPGTTQLCNVRASSTGQTARTGTLTHPSGAVGEFTFLSTLHGRSYVQKICPTWYQTTINGSITHDYAYYPRYFDVISLTKKKLSGPGQAAVEWNYAYGPVNASWASDCSAGCVTTKTVSVTGPGDFVRHTFGNRYKENEGKLLKVETGTSSASILKTEDSTYLLNPSGQVYPADIGWTVDTRSDGTTQRHSPLVQRKTIQQGRSFTWSVASGCTSGAYCFDTYARPTKVIKSSAPTP